MLPRGCHSYHQPMKIAPTPALLNEIAQTQTMLDTRYDEIKSGKAKLIPGDEAFARLHKRIQARSPKPAATGLEP